MPIDFQEDKPIAFTPLNEGEFEEYRKEKQYGEGAANQLKAFGEGALRGGSFGISDWVLPKIPGGPTEEALKERKKRRGDESFGGELVGIAASSLLPGGGLVGGATKLAGAAEKLVAPAITGALANKAAGSILAKAGKSAVGNAVLGSLYGTGNVVSEVALGDPDLNAQKIASQIGFSALVGGGLGAVLGGAAGSLSKTREIVKDAQKIASDKLKKPIEETLSFVEEAGLSKNMAKYAVDAVKFALPHGVTKAIDIGQSLMKAETLATIEALAQKANDRISKATNLVFTVGEDVSPFLVNKLSKSKVNEDYESAVKETTDVSDANVLVEKLDQSTKEVFPHAPQITNHVQMVMANASQFLNSKIPRPGVEAPLSEPFQPSEAQKEKFLNYYQVVNNPLIAMGQVKTGTLTKDTLEALQVVHPKLYQDMKRSMFDKLMTVKGKQQSIPYQTRVMLSAFLQEPLDVSLLPNSIIATQASYRKPVKRDTAMGGGMGRGSATRLGNLNVASRARTPNQRVESGSDF